MGHVREMKKMHTSDLEKWQNIKMGDIIFKWTC